jgi:hypothetical protein
VFAAIRQQSIDCENYDPLVLTAKVSPDCSRAANRNLSYHRREQRQRYEFVFQIRREQKEHETPAPKSL